MKWKHPQQTGAANEGRKEETAPAGAMTVRLPTPPVPATTQNAGAKFCSQCGARLEAGQKFCPACGTARTPVAAGTLAGGGREAKQGSARLNAVRSGTRRYDEAVRIGQEIERQVSHQAGLLGSEVFSVPLLFAGCVWHELWVVLGVGVVAAVIAAAYREGVRSCLRGHDVAGAKSRLGPAKFWFWTAWLADLVGFLLIVWHIAAACDRLG